MFDYAGVLEVENRDTSAQSRIGCRKYQIILLGEISRIIINGIDRY